MANPFDGRETTTNPLGGSAFAAGPGPMFKKLTTAHNDTLVDGTPVVAPLLPFTVRALRCTADVTVTIQDAAGNVVPLAMVAGDVHDLGYIRAMAGIADDKLVAYA